MYSVGAPARNGAYFCKIRIYTFIQRRKLRNHTCLWMYAACGGSFEWRRMCLLKNQISMHFLSLRFIGERVTDRVYFKLIILVGINFYQYYIFSVLVKVIKDELVVLKLVIQLD